MHYHGEFAALLSDLNENQDWRRLYGKKSARLKELELILRFFAIYDYAQSYRRPMKEFLNRYMATNRNLEKQSRETLTELFSRTVETISRAIGERAFRPQNVVNAAVVDSVMVGVASAIADQGVISDDDLRQSYNSLLDNKQYINLVGRSTADEEYFRQRIRLARAFCIRLYPYPAFLRYAAHSAGGYWARILPLASEIAS